MFWKFVVSLSTKDNNNYAKERGEEIFPRNRKKFNHGNSKL